ncbi:MAG: ribosome-associated translation inhibitor RaiA [Patescibacteria group bacterium]|jgi:putative sigma-54 modulation protein
MNLNIKATNIELTPAIKKYVEAKTVMLEKYFSGILDVKAEVELTTHHHHKGQIYRAELNVLVPGKLLRVEKVTKDLYKSIDKVKDHMALELKKFKEKKADKVRRGDKKNK